MGLIGLGDWGGSVGTEDRLKLIIGVPKLGVVWTALGELGFAVLFELEAVPVEPE